MKNKLIYISIFAIAMAFLETSVVIYLRELMYPEGFRFPLAPISPDLALTELLREAATMLMLLMVGILISKRFPEGLAWFLYSFAIWDIFYYVFLKVLIGWPESLLTWDILFLIPATWTGPVIAPVILSLLMIAFALIILGFETRGIKVRISKADWTLLVLGSIVIIIAFITDYSRFILMKFNIWEIFTIPDKGYLFDYAVKYVPVKFPWITFLAGFFILLICIFRMYLRWAHQRNDNRNT